MCYIWLIDLTTSPRYATLSRRCAPLGSTAVPLRAPLAYMPLARLAFTREDQSLRQHAQRPSPIPARGDKPPFVVLRPMRGLVHKQRSSVVEIDPGG